MATRITQALANRAREEFEAGTQVYDAEVSGLRLVVGKRSCSYKLVGRINDGTDRYVSIVIGRTDEVSLKTAREAAVALRLALRRGEDPRTPKKSVPNLNEAWDRYRQARQDDLRPRTIGWYEDKVNGPLGSLKKLPMDRIDRETVRSLHEKLTRERGPYCANGAMRALKAIYNDVCRTHDLPPNPVSRAVRLNRERQRDWAVGPNEMPELWRRLDSLKDRTLAACWLTMLLTGLRCGDARSMRWEHLAIVYVEPFGRRNECTVVTGPSKLTGFQEEVNMQAREFAGFEAVSRCSFGKPVLPVCRDVVMADIRRIADK